MTVKHYYGMVRAHTFVDIEIILLSVSDGSII